MVYLQNETHQVLSDVVLNLLIRIIFSLDQHPNFLAQFCGYIKIRAPKNTHLFVFFVHYMFPA
jgi:hypothetical protein